MRRKIIQLSTNTNVVSLPARWVRQNNLIKGDELELSLTDTTITLHTQRRPKKTRTEIVFDSDDTLIVWESIDCAYIKGSDEIVIRYSNPKLLEHIHKVVMRMIGMAVTEETKNTCVMKEVSGQNQEDFDVILRRIFLLVKTVAQEGIEAAIKKDFDTLAAMKFRDYNVNSFTSYCLRSLNKYGYAKAHQRQHMYVIVKQLEILGDRFRDICHITGKNKVVLGKATLSLFKQVSQLYDIFHKHFYKYDTSAREQMSALRNKVRPAIEAQMKKARGEELTVLLHMQHVASVLFDSYETVLVMNS